MATVLSCAGLTSVSHMGQLPWAKIFLKSDMIAGKRQLGHLVHSARVMCFPDARQKGMVFLQASQSSWYSGILFAQWGQGERVSG